MYIVSFLTFKDKIPYAKNPISTVLLLLVSQRKTVRQTQRRVVRINWDLKL